MTIIQDKIIEILTHYHLENWDWSFLEKLYLKNRIDINEKKKEDINSITYWFFLNDILIKYVEQKIYLMI